MAEFYNFFFKSGEKKLINEFYYTFILMITQSLFPNKFYINLKFTSLL